MSKPKPGPDGNLPLSALDLDTDREVAPVGAEPHDVPAAESSSDSNDEVDDSLSEETHSN